MEARPTPLMREPSTAEPRIQPAGLRGHRLRVVRRRCLVVPVSGDRPHARAVVELLASEMEDLDLVLDDDGGRMDAIWICGPREDAREQVRDLRARYPESLLVITGRGLRPRDPELVEAGGDCILGWPATVDDLREAFASRPVRR